MIWTKTKHSIIRLSESIDYVGYAIRDIVSKARELEAKGKDMKWLNIGDPVPYGFKPPEHIIDAMVEALNETKKTGKYAEYAPSRGIPELVDAIVDYENIDKEVENKNEQVERVFVTHGLSEGIDFLYQILVNPGEHILLPTPAYPLYVTKQKVFGRVHGKEPRIYCYASDETWNPDIEDLKERINNKTKAILIINPNNPTGAVYDESIIKGIVDIAEDKRIPIISDDAYEMLVLDSACRYKNPRELVKNRDVILISGGSISKNYIFPGARVGWLAIHGKDKNEIKKLCNSILKMANQRLSICAITQKGAVAALTGAKDHIKAFKQELVKRRDYLMKRINDIDGINTTKPKGGFYAFIEFDNKGWKDDWDLTYALLHAGVVCVPGSGFGAPRTGDKLYVRIVFLPDTSILETAIRRMETVVRKR